MQALIPIAGMGCRLAAITNLPKCLLTAGGKSLLAHTLDQALALGCDEAILVVRDDIVRERTGDRYHDLPLRYVRQAEPVGLGHAMVQARDLITGPFLLFLADFWRSHPLSEQTCRLFRHSDSALVLVSHQPNCEMPRLASVVLNNAEAVVRIEEKPERPPSCWAEAGLYRLPVEVLDAPLVHTPGQGYTLQAMENWLLDHGWPLQAIKAPANWVNINEPEDLFLARGRAAALAQAADPNREDDDESPGLLFRGWA